MHRGGAALSLGQRQAQSQKSKHSRELHSARSRNGERTPVISSHYFVVRGRISVLCAKRRAGLHPGLPISRGTKNGNRIPEQDILVLWVPSNGPCLCNNFG
ncbi:hypothetical protein CEXT_399671 [Caerostris extrusa]|uniref:Uncharacterized protein n=1 Tax=Caerostris extrusa TaxID=172846 RepID=A0AAV4Y1N5_CAEEX|nr:hypothetical protein CEXT_399671 [Caerostris extrusa]